MKPILSGVVLGSILLLTVGPETIKPPAAGLLAPFIQTSQNGAYVDWLDGHVGVRGTTLIAHKIAQNRAMYEQTKTAAEVQGHNKMLELLATIPRDGLTVLGADADLKTRIGERVGNQAADEIVRDSGPVFEVILKTPLWGNDSLIQLILGEPGPLRPATPVTTAGLPDISPTPIGDGPTGLIIDARGVSGATAALLPRILDESGKLIHGIDSADRAAVRERGLVAYATAPYGVDPLSGGVRQGDRPMMVKAQASTGATKADLIVRQIDADKLAGTAAAPAFLKECRVIILMSPPPLQKPHLAPGIRAAPQRKIKAADPNRIE